MDHPVAIAPGTDSVPMVPISNLRFVRLLSTCLTRIALAEILRHTLTSIWVSSTTPRDILAR